MGKQTFKYIGLCMAIYLSMSVVEIFLCKPFIDFIGTGFWTHMVVYCVLLLLVNPVVTYFVIDKFFKFEPEVITVKKS